MGAWGRAVPVLPCRPHGSLPSCPWLALVTSEAGTPRWHCALGPGVPGLDPLGHHGFAISCPSPAQAQPVVSEERSSEMKLMDRPRAAAHFAVQACSARRGLPRPCDTGRLVCLAGKQATDEAAGEGGLVVTAGTQALRASTRPRGANCGASRSLQCPPLQTGPGDIASR